MKRTLLTISIALLLGCSPRQTIVHTYTSYCVPESVFAAMVFQEKAKVRIAVQHIKEGRDHAYAEAFIDNKWVPLVVHWSFERRMMAVSTNVQTYKKEPYRYLSIKEWAAEQVKQ